MKRAARLEAYVANFFAEESVTATAAAYDCHTAIRASARERFVVYPFVPDRLLPEQQKVLLAEATSLPCCSRSVPTRSLLTSLNDAQVLPELGKVLPFGANDLSRFSGIKLLLRAVISGEGADRQKALNNSWCITPLRNPVKVEIPFAR